jgi:hypothetical protein
MTIENQRKAATFQSLLMDFGEQVLLREFAEAFGFFRQLRNPDIDQAIRILEGCPLDMRRILAKALPRRGKPVPLLQALGRSLTQGELAAIKQYTTAQEVTALPVTEFASGHPNEIWNEIVMKLDTDFGKPEVSTDRRSSFYTTEIDSLRVKTVVSFGGRESRISYAQFVHENRGGMQ